MTRAVAIGGGHGASRTVQALHALTPDVTAIVTVADDGGSSGRLRRDLGVIPPGDLRMAVSALADGHPWTALVDHRFAGGELAGHSLGNLMLIALMERHGGDIVAALDQWCVLLEATGRVLPCTTTPVTLHATSANGPVHGQAAIAATTRLERVWLEPSAPTATRAAVDAIVDADIVVIGPGSIYTSILPNLLVPGIAEAVRATSATVVFVGNLREQRGETEGMTLDQHVQAIVDHVGAFTADVAVIHDGPPAGSRPLHVNAEAVAAFASETVRADLWRRDDPHAGHDPQALARVFTELCRE